VVANGIAVSASRVPAFQVVPAEPDEPFVMSTPTAPAVQFVPVRAVTDGPAAPDATPIAVAALTNADPEGNS
jgi:hypothetical protein